MSNRKKQRAEDAARLRWIGRSIIALGAEVEQMAPGQRSSRGALLRGYASVLRYIGGELTAWGQ